MRGRLLAALAVAGALAAVPIAGAGADGAAVPVAGHSTIGHSVHGRPDRGPARRRPGADLKVLVVGSIHGDETQGHRVIRRLRGAYGKRIKGADFWTITTVNPDGVAADQRKNAHGVDLNRNFSYGFDPNLDGGYNSGPHPFSEPESKAVARLSKRVDFDLAVWYHQPWDETLVPCDSRAKYARRYAQVARTRRPPTTAKVYSPGSAISWQHHRFGTVAFVVELPGRRLHGAEVRRHARATVAVARMLK